MNDEKYITFNEVLDRYKPQNAITNNLEPFSSLDYSQELDLKNSAFREFLAINKIKATKIYSISPSPKPRHYRTTTKRKVVSEKNEYKLKFHEKYYSSNNEPISYSLLEPENHFDIYKYVHKKINEKVFRLVSKHLNYIIIRGTYDEFCLIFNLDQLNAQIVNKFKHFSKEIQNANLKITSCFLYLDPTKSNYYFENERPDFAVTFKKLFGTDKLFKKFHDIKYSLHPTSFSQINESIVPVLLEKTKELLGSEQKTRLIDLYSGYGLFSVYYKDSYDEIIGFESDSLSVKSAIENQKYRKGKARVTFIKGNICFDLLNDFLPMVDSLNPEVVIMDPPRKGNNYNVINYLASRSPSKILHIFCGIDDIPDALRIWSKAGYNPSKIVPMDLFPGTKSIETLILLQKK